VTALAYTVDGPRDAPVLVLGSSLGTSGAMWDPQVPALTEHVRLVRYDHRGHGRSPVPDGPYDLAELGADVLALMDALQLDQVHLGGLSLGGMVAMWVAANAPDRVDRLALLCTSAKLGPPEIWTQRIAAVQAGGMESIADMVVGRWFTPSFVDANPSVVAEVRQGLLDTPAAGYAGCCAAIQTMDLLADLPRVTAPTLVIAGTADVPTPPEHAHQIASLIPDARVEVVDGASHLANVSHVDTVTSLLVSFFTEDVAEDLAGEAR
jgi:3-oxoadipate enol-lactonase